MSAFRTIWPQSPVKPLCPPIRTTATMIPTKTSRISKFQLCAIALAAVAGANAYAATSSSTVTSSSINPGAATDSSIGSVATVGASSTGDTFKINKYNGTGVLTGASISTKFAPEAITFSSTSDHSAASGYAYGVGGFSVGGVNGSATSAHTATVTGVNEDHSKSGTIAAYTALGSATTQAQLTALYGGGTVKGTVAETLYSNLSSQSGSGTNFKADNTANRSATVTATYTSLNHANGAFDIGGSNALSYSFGDIVNGASPAVHGFNLYNLAGSYGLQVKSVSYSGDALFALGGITSGTSNLSADSFVAGTVNMAASTVAGLHSGTWTITLADSASGIGAGRNVTSTDALTLSATARVLTAPVAAVPEPETYAMMLAGLGLMGAIARRRRAKKD